MLTKIHMRRFGLITKEKMENYCKKEESVNDDLESLFDDLRLGKGPKEYASTNFFPKLTQEQMELVERKDTTYLHTFWEDNPDVKEAEMKLSESDSKYVEGWVTHHGWTEEHSQSKIQHY